LDAVEFAGFRSVIRGRAVKNSFMLLPELDDDGDGVKFWEAVQLCAVYHNSAKTKPILSIKLKSRLLAIK
jgi:hypothetical protein